MLLPVIDQWLTTLAAERTHSPITIRDYRRDLTHLAETLGAALAVPPRAVALGDLTLTNLRRWMAAQRALAVRTVSRRRSALASFVLWARREGWLTEDPTLLLGRPKVPRGVPRGLPPDRLRAWLEAVPRLTARTRRAAAVVELLYASGMRIGECAALAVEDLDLAARRVTIRRGKGGAGRLVPIGRRAVAALRAYLDDRTAALARPWGRPTAALWLGEHRRPLTATGLRGLVRTWDRATGLGFRVTPHVLRHSAALALIAGGMHMRAVQKVLGHRDLSTTQIYTDVSLDDLMVSYDQAHPRA